MTYTQGLRGLSLFTLLFAFIVCQATARTHLREGPRRNKPNVMLHGSAMVDSYWNGTPDTRKQVGWSAKLLKDIITWYDLSADNVRINSCSQQHVELAGEMLDADDYKPGSVFVIDVVDWESRCATPEVENGIPEEDDVLFYEIERIERSSSNRINLAIRRIEGEKVVPEVILDVAENQGAPAPAGTVGDVEIFGDDEVASVARQALSLPSMSRMQQLEKNATLRREVSLSFSAGVTAGISGFKLVRLIGLKFSWVQRLTAEARATFSVTQTVEAEASGRLLQVPIPGFGFRTGRIPFVGRASAGAFIRVDWVLELNAQTTVTADFDVRREVRRQVEAKVFPPSFSTKPLDPLVPNRQSSSLVFGAAAEAGINGFAGVRPALGLEVALGKKSAGGNIGVKVGLELDATIKRPPFPPLTSGRRLGVCDECHALQGELNIKIKDLSLQLERNRKITRDITLVEDILDINIATVCALPRACSDVSITPPSPLLLPSGSAVPSPTPTSTPKPPPRGSCKRCRRDRNCPANHKCVGGGGLIRRGTCHLRLSQGQACGGVCTICPRR